VTPLLNAKCFEVPKPDSSEFVVAVLTV